MSKKQAYSLKDFVRKDSELNEEAVFDRLYKMFSIDKTFFLLQRSLSDPVFSTLVCFPYVFPLWVQGISDFPRNILS